MAVVGDSQPAWAQFPWIQAALALPEGRFTLLRLPGVLDARPATECLVRALRLVREPEALVMGTGLVATALWAALQGVTVTCALDSRAEALSLEATFAFQRLPLPELHVSADFEWAREARYPLVLLHLPRGEDLQEELLRVAAAVLRPGGRLYAVGATREGVRGALTLAQRLFGQAGVVTRKGGYHTLMAIRPEGNFPLPQVAWTRQALSVDGKPALLESCPGVFAAGRLDDGAAALIAGMQIAPGQRALELGCGTGLVALAALRRGAQITAVDVSARAVEATRRTLHANGFAAAEVLLSYGAERVTPGTFDVVLTNPPFHAGYDVDFEVVKLFINDAARSLRAGGRLFLVANAFLPYETWLNEVFSTSEVVYHDGRFRVWSARR